MQKSPLNLLKNFIMKKGKKEKAYLLLRNTISELNLNYQLNNKNVAKVINPIFLPLIPGLDVMVCKRRHNSFNLPLLINDSKKRFFAYFWLTNGARLGTIKYGFHKNLANELYLTFKQTSYTCKKFQELFNATMNLRKKGYRLKRRKFRRFGRNRF